MRDRLVPGLRARLVAALVFTSAVTLAVAALALLKPLERRLGNDELESLRATAISSKPSFEDIEAKLPAAQASLNAARALEQRSGARVALFDRSGQVVADTRPSLPFGPLPRTRQPRNTRGQILSTPAGASFAIEAVPIRIHGAPYALALRKPLDDVTAAARDVKQAFGEAALAGLAIALLLGLGFAAYLVRRLRHLRDAALGLGAAGSTTVLPADSGRDEVGDLARAFRQMQLRLEQQEDTRRQFVATASHELRTPLASLQGMLELLEQDLKLDPPDLRDALMQVGRAEAQSRRLGTLAADLLDLTRLDAEVELRSEPVELGEIVRAVAAEFDLRIAHGGSRIELRGEGQACWANGDPGSIARIVRILIDNALRYSPSESPVTVTTASRDSQAEVSVGDDGPGVLAEEGEIIFERFRRGSGSTSEGGFGLGLAIGRGLARRMGGELSLDPHKHGTRFALRLPSASEVR